MILKLIRKISEFEDIFSSGVIFPKNENNFNNYLILYENTPYILDDEFIIELKLKRSNDFLELKKGIFYYPRSIFIEKNNIVSIEFHNDRLVKIFKGRMLNYLEMKDRDFFSERINVIKSFETVEYRDTELNDYDNPIFNNENEIAKIVNSIWGVFCYSLMKNITILIEDKEILSYHSKFKQIYDMNNDIKKIKCVAKEFNRVLLKKEFTALNLTVNNENRITFNFINENNNLEGSLFDFIVKELLLIDKDYYKDSLILIGKKIKEDKKLNNYIEDYRCFYDIYINGNMSIKIKDIHSNVLKALLIAFLHYKNINTLDETCIKNQLDCNSFAYVFAGILKGYDNISGSDIDYIKQNKFYDILIENEKKVTSEFFNKYYKYLLDNNVVKLNNSNNIHNRRNQQIFFGKGHFVYKNHSRSILTFFSKDFKIIFNEKKTKEFEKGRKNMREIDKNERYQSYKVVDYLTRKNLNAIRMFKFTNELILYNEKKIGDNNEKYPY